MLEMWKVVDPFCKCGAYFTDEEEAFDSDKLRSSLRAVDSAVSVKATIDGREMTLWKITYGNGGASYMDEAERNWIREICTRYLKAHDERVRVDVTAKELKAVRV